MLAAYLFLPLRPTCPSARRRRRRRSAACTTPPATRSARSSSSRRASRCARRTSREVLKDAVVAAEDRSFYSHGGVDVRGTLRALLADLRNRGVSQGGSTITQQFVKNTLTGGERSIPRKIREAILASQLDRQVDKDDILFEYLSIIYLGEGAYGVGAAAETYFRKPVQRAHAVGGGAARRAHPGAEPLQPAGRPGGGREEAPARARRDARRGDDHRGRARARPPTSRCGSAAHGPPPGPAHRRVPARGAAVERPVLHRLRGALARRRTCPAGVDQIFQGGLSIETTLDPDPAGRRPTRRSPSSSTAPRPTCARRSSRSSRRPASCGPSCPGATSPPTRSTTRSGRAAAAASGPARPGSAFKPFVLAQAFETGITPDAPYSGRPHDVTEPCGPAAAPSSTTTRAAATARSPLRTATGSRSTPCSPG